MSGSHAPNGLGSRTCPAGCGAGAGMDSAWGQEKTEARNRARRESAVTIVQCMLCCAGGLWDGFQENYSPFSYLKLLDTLITIMYDFLLFVSSDCNNA